MFLILIFCLFSAPAYALRMISLEPVSTEILYSLGKQDSLIATSDYSLYPESAKKLPKISKKSKYQTEKIIALKPDWVIGVDLNYGSLIEELSRAKIKVKLFSAKSLKDFPLMVKEIAAISKSKKKAKEIIQQWNQDWNFVVHSTKKYHFLMLHDFDPYFIEGKDNFLSEALAKCNLVNANQSTSYRRVDREYLNTNNYDTLLFSEAIDRQELKRHFSDNKWKKINKISFPAKEMTLMSPRLPRLVSELCRSLST